MFRCSNCICYKNTTAYGTHNLFFHKMVDMAVNVDEGSSEDEEIHDKEIFSKTLFHYQEMSDEMETRGNQLLIDILQTGAITCLICIDNVKRLDAIWNCVNCYCILHLPCIQKWAREGANQQQFSSQGKFDKEDSIWNCPKCRFEYKGMECLVKYTCFCGKENDPCFDPWIVPHSCGQTCSKSLRPNCGHECILLCHPGPCPPCPKTILSRCYCENSNPQLQRCSKKGWSCGQPCGKLSSCGIHYCEDFCHSGDCSPCSKMGKHFCLCKKVEDMQPCAKRNWSCSQVCHKVLSCGHHLCEKECHASPCGECPRFGSRKCPCGKTSFSLPCVDDVSTCEDTCLKLLSCGSHQCAKRCHYGPCETCIQVVRKVCKCQHKVKEVPCNQALMCEFKCLKLRKCGRHACKKKCCNGNCPPCEQVCNRILNCNNHKCPSPCHSGICYPCPISKKVSCFCGNTSILVPCGKEKSVKPPNCKELCRIPSACHHKVQAHQCHFGDCPLCSEVCNKELPCSHHCQVKCHDEVLKENIGEKFQTKNTDGLISKRSPCVPCPPCSYLVEKFCVGEHCVESFPCSKVKAYSCKFFCGRLISCGNHVCKRKCHLVKGNPPQGKAGKNCMSCKEVCLKSRTTGCVHNCKLACHPGECPPCDEYLKLDCHCHLVKLYIKCQEFTLANDHQKEELLSCKSRCTKVLQCGHFCKKLCHNGNCSDSLSCAEKSHLSCSCGRRKKVLLCADVSCGMELECDEQCIDLKMKKQQVDEAKIIANKLAQIKRDQDELKLYENRKKGRKRSHKHQTCFPDNLDVSFSFKQSYLCRVLWLFFVFCLCIITMSLLII